MKQYFELFKKPGFAPFLWTQFLGAFNDNVFKIVISMLAIKMVAESGGAYLSMIGAIFILPFLLFSGYAGDLADRLNKRRIMIWAKGFEIGVMSLGCLAFLSGQIEWMMVVLFLMSLQSTFFSPAKYGILPEMLPDKDLSRANGLVEMSTFLAIILGTSLGGLIYSLWSDRLALIGVMLIVVAITGYFTSLRMGQVATARAKKTFTMNPWGEIAQGVKRLYSDRTLWLTVLGIAYFWFLGAFLQLDLLLLGSEVMKLDELKISLLGTFLAVGIGIGSLLAGRLSGDKVELGLVPIGAIGMGLFSMMLAFSSHSYWQTGFALSLLGCAGGLFSVPLHALLQQKSGEGERGQLIATANFIQTIGILLASGALWLLHDVLHISANIMILIVGSFSLLVMPYVFKLLPEFFIRFILWLLTHTIYRIRIRGQEHVPFRGPALLVCNHVSFVDGLLVGACVQRFIRFLVHKDFFKMRRLESFFTKMQAIPVSAGNRKAIIESIRRAHDALAQGHVVCIFAEGAISRTGNMLPFKKGFEHMAKGLDVPIIPVHLDGLWGSIFSFEQGKFFWKWPRQIPFPVTVSFGEPLPATATAQAVRQAVMDLGSEAVPLRRKPTDLLHLKFIESAKSAWKQACMDDSTGKSLTYGKALIGALLLSRNIRQACKNQKMVGLMLPSSVGGALANIATLLAGKVPVNLNFTAGKAAIDSAVQQCEIKTILSSKIFIKKAKLDHREEMLYLEDLSKKISPMDKVKHALLAFLLPARWIQRFYSPEKSDPNSLATVIFSSGSTGEPKGVMLSHHNVLSNVEALAQLFWVTKKDKMMGVLPFFHSFGFSVTLWFPLIARFSAVYHPNPMDAKVIGELVQKHKVTIIISTPTFYNAYIRRCSKEAFASLRYAMVGAEKQRKEIAEAFRKKYDLNLLEGYGCTELSPVVCVNVDDVSDRRESQKGLVSGTVGHPLPGVSVKIVDPENMAVILRSGQEGLLLVKGPNLMMGYLNQPAKTAEVIRNDWYNTGDIARVDGNGFLQITDRLSRFSKIGGEMVPHIKIEEEVIKILESEECAVTAVPDDKKGEKLVVFYVKPETNPEMSPATLWSLLKENNMPLLWLPKGENFYPVEELPTLGTGKRDLRALKLLALEAVGKF